MVLIRKSVVMSNLNWLFLVNHEKQTKKTQMFKKKNDFCHLILYIKICFLLTPSEQMSK